MAKTGATPADVHSAAERHRTSGDSFITQMTAVENEVDGLFATNTGDLMKMLDKLQNDWSEDVKLVKGKLDEMADYLDTVANKLQEQDTEAASSVGSR